MLPVQNIDLFVPYHQPVGDGSQVDLVTSQIQLSALVDFVVNFQSRCLQYRDFDEAAKTALLAKEAMIGNKIRHALAFRKNTWGCVWADLP